MSGYGKIGPEAGGSFNEGNEPFGTPPELNGDVYVSDIESAPLIYNNDGTPIPQVLENKNVSKKVIFGLVAGGALFLISKYAIRHYRGTQGWNNED